MEMLFSHRHLFQYNLTWKIDNTLKLFLFTIFMGNNKAEETKEKLNGKQNKIETIKKHQNNQILNSIW